MIEKRADIILTCDLPEHGLARGDIGTVVLIHKGGKGYEVEFTTLDGQTIPNRIPRSSRSMSMWTARAELI